VPVESDDDFFEDDFEAIHKFASAYFTAAPQTLEDMIS